MKRKLNLQKVRNVPFFIIFVVIMFLGLPLDITAEDMENLLSKQEKLQKFILACHYGVFIILFKKFQTTESKGYGFAYFEDLESAIICKEKFHKTELRGNKISTIVTLFYLIFQYSKKTVPVTLFSFHF
jgi:RNA recognition motif-containing protein